MPAGEEDDYDALIDADGATEPATDVELAEICLVDLADAGGALPRSEIALDLDADVAARAIRAAAQRGWISLIGALVSITEAGRTHLSLPRSATVEIEVDG